MVRVDLHLHSSASFDCKVPPQEVAARCRRLGLSPIFLTDHDTIDGAATLRSERVYDVVIGEEVMTTEGELIGLFLREPIPGGLTPEDTVRGIKAQGGLVLLEHPYDKTRRNLGEDAIRRLAKQIDIVEVFNGRSAEQANRTAEELSNILGVPAAAGSDAHTLSEIGRCYVEMDAFQGAQDFLVKLAGARIVRRSSLLETARARFRFR